MKRACLTFGRRTRLAIEGLVMVAAIGAVMALPARAAVNHAVDIVDFAFAPATLTVTVGDTVTWTNRDQVVHTATSTSGAFDSGDLAQGASYSLTFTSAGSFDYLCTPHPSMTGMIVVADAPASAPSPGTGAIPDVAMAPPAPGSLIVSGLALLLIIGLAIGVSGSGRKDD